MPCPTLGNRITFSALTEVCDASARRHASDGQVSLDEFAKSFFRLLPIGRASTRLRELLGTTTRTLRRQLRDENVSFRQLMDELRAHIAMKYLQETTMTNEDIAFALGFSDAANFRHAFRRWTKKTPARVPAVEIGHALAAHDDVASAPPRAAKPIPALRLVADVRLPAWTLTDLNPSGRLAP